MTVKEAVSTLKYAKRIYLAYGDEVKDVDLHDPIMLMAWEDYKVDSVYATYPNPDEKTIDEYVVCLATAPIKENKE